MMDNGSAHIIYYTTSAPKDLDLDFTADPASEQPLPGEQIGNLPSDLRGNIETLSSVFNTISLCRRASSCLSRIRVLYHEEHETIPSVVIIEVTAEDTQKPNPSHGEPRSPSPKSSTEYLDAHSKITDPDELVGLSFLPYLASEARQQHVSHLVIPVVVLPGHATPPSGNVRNGPRSEPSQSLSNSVLAKQYLDAGAVDVMISPFTEDRVLGLTSYAYRALKESSRQSAIFAARQNRSKSWVGVSDGKPYAYLREKMVSGLMARICDPDHAEDDIDPDTLDITPDRRNAIAEVVGSWTFSAHEFTDDELLHGCFLMLQHALEMPELEKWRMTEEQLITFLMASRRVYNSFVLYHNFRHACDVLQAVFCFLVQLGTIPPMNKGLQVPEQETPLGSLLQPFHALTLLIAAIGHDVGHPGVNNSFLVTLNAPLAQLYNDRSVLESFHCAAYSQLLRRYWPVAFSDIAMRKLMINSILATDMGLHVQYMTQLGNLQEKFHHNTNTVDGWNDKTLEEYRDLLCCLLIKCADICNVAREFKVATQWASILTDEFCNQGAMEQELHMPTCLFGGPPDRDDIIKMGSSQIGFMNIFASPLFGSVSDILPPMKFTVDQLEANKAHWQDIIAEEKERRKISAPSDGTASPHSTTGPTDTTSMDEKEGRQSEHGLKMGVTPRAHFNMSPSGSTSRKVSTPHLSGTDPGFDPSRRASLGPTVMPNRSKREGSPRRSSGGFPRTPPSQHQGSPRSTSYQQHLDSRGTEQPSWLSLPRSKGKEISKSPAVVRTSETPWVAGSEQLRRVSNGDNGEHRYDTENRDEPTMARSSPGTYELNADEKLKVKSNVAGIGGRSNPEGPLEERRKRSFPSLKFWKKKMCPDRDGS